MSGGRPAHNRIEPPEDVTVAYVAGESVLSIATRLGVSRRVVDRWLREAGIQARGPKEAGLLRVVLTDEERVENRRAVTRNYRAKKRGQELPSHLEHGSPGAIAIYACPCDVCRDAKREYDRQRREDKAAELTEQARIYRLNNIEAIRAYGRRKYKEDAEARKAQVRKYQQTEQGKLVKRATEAKRRGVPFTEAGREFAAIVVKDPCAYCGEPGGTVDHIVAVAAGGDGDWTNLTGACRTCNSRKRAMPLLHFMIRLQDTSMTASQRQAS